MKLFRDFIRRLRLNPKIEVKRINPMLHGCFTYTSHECTPFASFLVVDNFEAFLKGCNFLKISLACIFGCDVDHDDKYKNQHRKPMARKEVNGQNLPTEKSCNQG